MEPAQKEPDQKPQLDGELLQPLNSTENFSVSVPDELENKPVIAQDNESIFQSVESKNTSDSQAIKKEMSQFEKLTLVVQSFGLIVTIGTLFFLGKQVADQSVATKAQTEAVQSATYQGIMDKMFEIDKIFIENPKLRPYFFEKKLAHKNDADYQKVISIADYHLDFFQMLWSQSSFLPELQRDSTAWRSWSGYMKDLFGNSSVLCDRLEDTQSSYEEDFVDYILKRNKWCEKGAEKKS
jgi:hypothetical protein